MDRQLKISLIVSNVEFSDYDEDSIDDDDDDDDDDYGSGGGD